MNQTERDLIARLFERIRGVATEPRDPEAEDYISEQVARQPHAPYAMAQTVVVQDRALQAANARIEELERDLAEARGEGGGPSPWGPRAQDAMGRPGGFGAGDDGDRRAGGYSPPFGAPRGDGGAGPGYGSGLAYGSPPPDVGQQPQPQADAPRGGGFLSGALQTAAGVAAGALLFQGVRSLFGGGEEGHGGGEAARFGGEGASEAGSGSTMDSISDQFAGWFGGDRSAEPPNPDNDDAGGFDPDDGDDRWI